MTPTECKEDIEQTAQKLEERANHGIINQSAISGILQVYCEDAQRHTGIGAKNFMPERHR